MNKSVKKQPEATIKQWLENEGVRKKIEEALPKTITKELFSRVALTSLMKNEKLLTCTKESVIKCLLDLAAMGLLPDGRRAHLLPYKDECTLLIDYKGLVELVKRSPDVKNVECLTICENDLVTWENGEVFHKIDPKKSRGEIVSTYTKLTHSDGSVTYGEPFYRQDAELARKSSKAAQSGPWLTHYAEMWKKSNIRKDSKMWTLTPEVQLYISNSDEHENDMRNVTPNPQKEKHPGLNPFLLADENTCQTLTEETNND